MADLPTPLPPSLPASLDSLPEFLLLNILARLPAKYFALAACVNKEINRVANTVFSRPKIASAMSFNQDDEVAIKEVLEKVLSEPIRPQFAFVAVDLKSDVNFVSELISNALGTKIPLIVFTAEGSSGKEVLTNEVTETASLHFPESGGYINLMIGSLPGIKIDVIPLLVPKHLNENLSEKNCRVHIKRFVKDVMEFSDDSPLGIILMASCCDEILEQVVHTLDNDLPFHTFLVGGKILHFCYRSKDPVKDARMRALTSSGVGFLFAKENTPGFGNIRFDIAIASGMKADDYIYRPVNMKCFRSGFDAYTSLEGFMNGQVAGMEHYAVEIGISKKIILYAGFKKINRNLTTKAWNPTKTSYEILYPVKLGSIGRTSITIEGSGIESRDSFRMYMHLDRIAETSINGVSHGIHTLLEDDEWKRSKSEVIGGIIFFPLTYGSIGYCSPFIGNVPTIPFVGTCCDNQIIRSGGCKLTNGDGGEDIEENKCLLPRGATYVLISYSPPPPSLTA